MLIQICLLFWLFEQISMCLRAHGHWTEKSFCNGLVCWLLFVVLCKLIMSGVSDLCIPCDVWSNQHALDHTWQVNSNAHIANHAQQNAQRCIAATRDLKLCDSRYIHMLIAYIKLPTSTISGTPRLTIHMLWLLYWCVKTHLHT